MVQKSGSHQLIYIKTRRKYWDICLPYQLVSRISEPSAVCKSYLLRWLVFFLPARCLGGVQISSQEVFGCLAKVGLLDMVCVWSARSDTHTHTHFVTSLPVCLGGVSLFSPLFLPDVANQCMAILSSYWARRNDQWKNIGCLGCIGGYTTLCSRVYWHPINIYIYIYIQESLFNSLYNGK